MWVAFGISAFTRATGATLVDRVFLEVLITELGGYCRGSGVPERRRNAGVMLYPRFVSPQTQPARLAKRASIHSGTEVR
jgi:hypothetical protein